MVNQMDQAGEPIPVDVYRAGEDKSFKLWVNQLALDYAIRTGKALGGLSPSDTVKAAKSYAEFVTS